MPITSSAKKALRSSLRKKEQNDTRRIALREAVKGVKKAGTKASVKDVAAAYKAIDKALKRGLIKKNTAARKKAQVARLAKAK